MCPRHYIKETDGYMDAGLFRKLVDEVAAERPDAILLPFWRGESCMHPEFVGLLDYALNRGLRVHLSTNGHYMDEHFKQVFYRCEFLTFSLHSKVGFKNAQKFIDTKPSWSKATTQISFVDSEKTTQRYFPGYVADPQLKGFNGIRLYVEHTLGGEFGKSRETSEAERTFCPKLEHTFVVAADGSFSRCNHIWTPETAVNLSATTLKAVWTGERMQQIRNRYPDEKCTPCDQWSGHTHGEAWRRKPEGGVEHLVFGGDPGKHAEAEHE
jgi:hypothetical protein